VFAALVICPDEALLEAILRLAQQTGQVLVAKTLDHYPAPYELERLLSAGAPDVLFVELTDAVAAIGVARQTRRVSPATATVGVGGNWERETAGYREATGICALLPVPLSEGAFRDSLRRAVHAVSGDLQPGLFAFLPAKAGSGATVTALHVAGCLAEPLGRRVVLIEADLRSGVLQAVTQASPESEIQTVLANPGSLTRAQWLRFVARKHGVDLLLTNRLWKGPAPEWIGYHHLLEFVAAEYDFALVDLPELVNDATREVVRRAQCVCIVTTPELPALDLARQRSAELLERGVGRDRIQLIVTRWHNSDPGPEHFEKLLGHTVAAALSSDYPSLCKAIQAGELVPSSKALGKAYLTLAKAIAGIDDPAPPASVLARARSGLGALIGSW
jgi:pilus assembly protein CpaE